MTPNEEDDLTVLLVKGVSLVIMLVALFAIGSFYVTIAERILE